MSASYECPCVLSHLCAASVSLNVPAIFMKPSQFRQGFLAALSVPDTMHWRHHARHMTGSHRDEPLCFSRLYQQASVPRDMLDPSEDLQGHCYQASVSQGQIRFHSARTSHHLPASHAQRTPCLPRPLTPSRSWEIPASSHPWGPHLVPSLKHAPWGATGRGIEVERTL